MAHKDYQFNLLGLKNTFELTHQIEVLGKLPPGKLPSRQFPPWITPTPKISTQDKSHLDNFHPG